MEWMIVCVLFLMLLPIYVFMIEVWRRIMICESFVVAVKSIVCIQEFVDAVVANNDDSVYEQKLIELNVTPIDSATSKKLYYREIISRTIRDVAMYVSTLVDSADAREHITIAIQRFDVAVDDLTDVICARPVVNISRVLHRVVEVLF